ncbi:mannose-1-phosphate guanylyltransferase/mannose-6-phosphate isomerase [Chthonobacter rhizosphaerae]|uniref:mannose-1-phosphate guanylyltransferase/mannose-6-phosphate isomerase n=1 Tax=Chthonobacter rhizosphaerae TaxID=2735553 RepID=UPI0015EECDC7|nr:mannose-1-phosphate guanylyltransferase/mannose-6-phosphate isomerase [Chthonobacter rhizosphaerae]
MSNAKIVPVILAGGSGTRLWPVSRDSFPKQFQPLVGKLSTYQQTLKRVSEPSLFADPVVVTGDAFRFFTQRQARDVGSSATVVLEPARRDSAAAMAAAAVFVERRSPGSLVLALAADHVILDDGVFQDAIRLGAKAASAGKIVVFGLVPNEPKTSYGYIRPGAPIDGEADLRLVDAFVEKPNASTALEYLEAGYLWNSGNFLFRSDVMIREFRAFAPDILEAAEASVASAEQDLGFVRLGVEAFQTARKTSIDYAVIEKTRDIAVVYGRFRWSDVGAWDAIWQVSEQDADGNAIHGNGYARGSRNCLIHSDGILTTVVGAEDLLVIATADAVMVAPKDRAQDVKTLVDSLKAEGVDQVSSHRRDYRPWGYVEAIDEGSRFAVKRIVVDPDGTLSLQRHHHRAEHWVVVRGTATVTIDGEERLLTENQSLYLPVGSVHRLSNKGRIPLELIEVQTGSYLNDDDIERFDDVYRRV